MSTRKIAAFIFPIFSMLAVGLLLGACGEAGDVDPCTVADNGDGTYTLSCPDGSEVIVSDGTSGSEEACTIADNEDGTYTLQCPDGTEATFPGAGSEPADTVIYGTYTIANSLDVQLLDGVTEITGNLIVAADGIPSFVLPDLENVGGDIFVEVDNEILTSFSMPALTTLGGDLMVRQSWVLDSVDLPALSSVGGSLFISNCDELTVLDLSALSSVLVDLHVWGNVHLPSLELPALRTVGGSFEVGSTFELTSLEAPGLISIGGLLHLRSNLELSTFSLGDLTSVGGNVDFTGNDVLAQCLIDALIDQLTTLGGEAWSSGNNEDCTCEEVDGELVATCE